jgi:hypothetical protein
VAIVAVTLGVAGAMYASGQPKAGFLRHVADFHWPWLAAASLTEVLSMVALARLYRVLLRAKEPWFLSPGSWLPITPPTPSALRCR